LHLTSVSYAGNAPEKLITSRGKDIFPNVNLTPISTEILNQSAQEKILIVFARGPLNLTPLITSLRLAKDRKDIFIGIPNNIYKKLNKKYSDEFSSLYGDNGLFFYDKALWCSADINAQESKIVLEDVRKRPKCGTRDFKNDHSIIFEENLRNGMCQEWPRIVCAPINQSITNSLFGSTDYSFENNIYKLPKFSPGYIILESVNERVYSIEPILSLIESWIEKDISGIIHFSWPYPNGLSTFLKRTKVVEKQKPGKIQLFHLGIRYCIEMKDVTSRHILGLDKSAPFADVGSYINSHKGFSNISLEGDSWDTYYPSGACSYLARIKLAILYPNDNDYQALLNREGPFDGILSELRNDASIGESSDYETKYQSLLRFPPFTNSFILPKETKMKIQMSTEEYRTAPICDVMDSIDTKLPSLSLFKSLCCQLDNSKDIQNSINRVFSGNVIGKTTALSAYLLDKIINPTNVEDNLIIANYYHFPATRKAVVDRITGILETLKRKPELSLNTLPIEDYFGIFPSGSISSKRERHSNSRFSLKKLEFDRIDRGGENIITIKAKYSSNEGVKTEMKMNIAVVDFQNLQGGLRDFVIERTELIMPGPIPIFHFEDGIPVISKGYDILYRPFKRITIFSYPGDELNRCFSQLNNIQNLLVGPKSNKNVRRDIELSIDNNPSKFVVKVPVPFVPKDEMKTDDIFELPDSNFIDSSFRESQVQDIKAKDLEQGLELEDIWKNITRTSRPSQYNGQSINRIGDYVKMKIRFIGDNHEESIIMNRTSYVRIIIDGETEVMMVDSVKRGDRIAYIVGEEKESLDNLFIRSFSESRGWTIEEVLEPFTYLCLFYKVMNNYFKTDSGRKSAEELYWLSPAQLGSMIEILSLLMDEERNDFEFHDAWNSLIKNSCVWKSLVGLKKEELESLRSVFLNQNGITIEKMHALAKSFGLNYNISSFKQIISRLNSGKRKYYFEEPNNLLALGNLVESEDIKNTYLDLTMAGKEIRTVLELEGFSISRVLSNTDNPINEMDSLIRKIMVICEVVEIL
jgi:hypothetical protein